MTWSTEGFYKPYNDRVLDTQYRRRLRLIMGSPTRATWTPQGPGARTCFGILPQMDFDLTDGVPLITERNIRSWRSAIGEIIAFMNGARTVDEIESYGVHPAFWGAYRGKGTALGLADPDDMGPGSYGAVFHDWERADGTKLNQFAQLVQQIREYPEIRTHRIVNWRPEYTARGPHRKVEVAPCHGELHFRILDDGKLHMRMDQRSADFPIGVPHNMIQYAALLLMMCQVTGHKPGLFIHSFSDAHIYDDQVEAVEDMLGREPRRFPALHLDGAVRDLFAFRIEHFRLEDYDPHPAIKMPFNP